MHEASVIIMRHLHRYLRAFVYNYGKYETLIALYFRERGSNYHAVTKISNWES